MSNNKGKQRAKDDEGEEPSGKRDHASKESSNSGRSIRSALTDMFRGHSQHKKAENETVSLLIAQQALPNRTRSLRTRPSLQSGSSSMHSSEPTASGSSTAPALTANNSSGTTPAGTMPPTPTTNGGGDVAGEVFQLLDNHRRRSSGNTEVDVPMKPKPNPDDPKTPRKKIPRPFWERKKGPSYSDKRRPPEAVGPSDEDIAEPDEGMGAPLERTGGDATAERPDPPGFDIERRFQATFSRNSRPTSPGRGSGETSQHASESHLGVVREGREDAQSTSSERTNPFSTSSHHEHVMGDFPLRPPTPNNVEGRRRNGRSERIHFSDDLDHDGRAETTSPINIPDPRPNTSTSAPDDMEMDDLYGVSPPEVQEARRESLASQSSADPSTDTSPQVGVQEGHQQSHGNQNFDIPLVSVQEVQPESHSDQRSEMPFTVTGPDVSLQFVEPQIPGNQGSNILSTGSQADAHEVQHQSRGDQSSDSRHTGSDTSELRVERSRPRESVRPPPIFTASASGSPELREAVHRSIQIRIARSRERPTLSTWHPGQREFHRSSNREYDAVRAVAAGNYDGAGSSSPDSTESEELMSGGLLEPPRSLLTECGPQPETSSPATLTRRLREALNQRIDNIGGLGQHLVEHFQPRQNHQTQPNEGTSGSHQAETHASEQEQEEEPPRKKMRVFSDALKKWFWP